MFYLLYVFLKDFPSPIRSFSSFSAAVIFSFYTAQANGPNYNIMGAFLPACVLFLYFICVDSDANAPRSKLLLNVFGLSVCASFLAAFDGLAYIIQNFIIIFVIFLVFFIFSQSKRRFFVYALFSLVLISTVSFSFVIGSFLFVQKVAGQFLNGGSSWILANLDRQTLFYALQIFPGAAAEMLEEIAMLGIAFAALFYFKARQNTHLAQLMLALFFSLFIVIFLYSNFAPPFGVAFGALLSVTDLLLVFRYSPSSFYYIDYFILGTLFAIGSAFILSALCKAKKQFAVVFAIAVVLILLTRVYYIAYLPATTDRGMTIRQYVFDLSNYLNAQKGDFNVALLPAESPFFHQSTWYNGTDVYTYFLTNAGFTGGYINAGQFLISAEPMGILCHSPHIPERNWKHHRGSKGIRSARLEIPGRPGRYHGRRR